MAETNSVRKRMNIIIVAKSHSTPISFDLGSRRGRLVFASLAAVVVGFCGLLGFGLALLVADPRTATLSELKEMRSALADYRRQVGNVESESRRDLDALALQLGQLRAQATRLNALGDRLTRAGKLDDGEFDFAVEPALGGPEDPLADAVAPMPLNASIDSLRAEFDRQEAQLGVLENLLFDRKIDNALLPAGMPVRQGYIVSGYGQRVDPINGHNAVHLGVDFDAPIGSDILAVAEGVVTWSGERNGYGRVVEIDHGNGYMTRYAHNSKNLVEVGQRVHVGDVVAAVGSSGRSTGPHCHFEVWLNGRPVNPIAYVKSTRATRT